LLIKCSPAIRFQFADTFVLIKEKSQG